MKLKSIFVVGIILFVAQPLSTPWALELISPPQDTVVHPGDTITIKVRPSPGEKIGRVYFDGLFGEKVEAPPYESKYKVGPHDIGPFTIDIFAIAPPISRDDNEGRITSEIELRLISTLPPTTVVKEIDAAIASGKAKSFMILYKHDNGKLVLTSDGIRKVTAGALYSDGVWREITAHPETTYASSDEKVLKVTPPGKWTLNDEHPEYISDDNRPGTGALVTAVGPGTAKIIVRHGPYEDLVTGVVNVKPCSEWKKQADKDDLPVCN